MRRKRGLFFFQCFCWLAVGALLAGMAALLGFLLFRGAPGLGPGLLFGKTPAWQAVTGQLPVWDGIWPALVGTFYLTCLSLLLALAPGVGCGIYLSQYASPTRRAWGNSAIELLAGIPSIVMGLFGFVLIVLLRRTFFPQANTSLLLAATCLALLVLPVLVVTTREALDAVPRDIRRTAMSLGIGHTAFVGHILLPAAARGIMGGVVLALGRAAEDTAVIMLTGAVANSGLPGSLLGKFEALPFHIYVTAAEYQSQEQLAQGFSSALVLLALSVSLLGIASWTERRYRQHWQGGKA